MKLFSFDKEVGRPMARYNSNSVFYSHISKIDSHSNIGCLNIEPRGVVGLHEAPAPQLFLVVQGEGWICSEKEEKLHVRSGDGVFCEKGEIHESGSDSGMTVIIIQCEHFDLNNLPSKFEI
jgi:quercetin dioxygenase-like cupin family protein